MGAMASQITSLTIAYSAIYSGTDQIKYQSFASQAFMRGIHRLPVNSPHKGPVMRKTKDMLRNVIRLRLATCEEVGGTLGHEVYLVGLISDV